MAMPLAPPPPRISVLLALRSNACSSGAVSGTPGSDGGDGPAAACCSWGWAATVVCIVALC